MKNKSFTLIELLVVIAIIGLLASIVIVNLTGTRSKANIARGLQFSQSVHHALGAYAVGVWSFDEGSGTTAFDASGYGNNGTINGASYTTDTPSNTGYALSFDGSSRTYVSTPNIEIPNTYTFSQWVKGNINDQLNENIYSFGWNGKIGFRHALSGKNPCTGILIRNEADTSYHTVQTSTNHLDNKWHHLVAIVDRTKDPIEVKVYLDVKIEISSMIIDHFQGTLMMIIGTWSTSYGHFTGDVDNVRIYEKALETAQIKALYYAGLDSLLARGLMDEQEYQEKLVRR